uniref:Uncharacterized protein n=1 Tax=Amphimedon queenslandica TaxID=400682 RepID=A0A1X7T0N3_AMPQE
MAKLKKALRKVRHTFAQRKKVINLADRFNYSWKVVKEYESDELADNMDDEKRIAKAEKAAEKRAAAVMAKKKLLLGLTLKLCHKVLLYRSATSPFGATMVAKQKQCTCTIPVFCLVGIRPKPVGNGFCMVGWAIYGAVVERLLHSILTVVVVKRVMSFKGVVSVLTSVNRVRRLYVIDIGSRMIKWTMGIV